MSNMKRCFMGRTDNAKRNLIWGFIQKIVSVLIPFVSRTIMIYVLGMEYIGLNSLLHQFFQC